MPLIETRDLWKTYVMGDEEIHALRGVSIAIERGGTSPSWGRPARASPR
ncbi:MAG: hypothetical protein R2712_20070 [Vicinamibacterales bacterium]